MVSAQVFIYLIFISLDMVKIRSKVRVMVSCRVRVRFNNFHMSYKSRTASYLAMQHIWHYTGARQSALSATMTNW